MLGAQAAPLGTLLIMHSHGRKVNGLHQDNILFNDVIHLCNP